MKGYHNHPNWTFSFKSNLQEKINWFTLWDWYVTQRKGILIDLPSEISVETSCNGHCELFAVLMDRTGEKVSRIIVTFPGMMKYV